MVIAKQPTAFMVMLRVKVEERDLVHQGYFQLLKGDTLGRFVDLVVKAIVGFVEVADTLAVNDEVAKE